MPERHQCSIADALVHLSRNRSLISLCCPILGDVRELSSIIVTRHPRPAVIDGTIQLTPIFGTQLDGFFSTVLPVMSLRCAYLACGLREPRSRVSSSAVVLITLRPSRRRRRVPGCRRQSEPPFGRWSPDGVVSASASVRVHGLSSIRGGRGTLPHFVGVVTNGIIKTGCEGSRRL